MKLAAMRICGAISGMQSVSCSAFQLYSGFGFPPQTRVKGIALPDSYTHLIVIYGKGLDGDGLDK